MNHTAEVREFVINNYLFGDGTQLKDEQSFLESGMVDSTGMLELIMFLESNYSIKVQPQEMVPENLDSINRVVQFLAKKAPAAAD